LCPELPQISRVLFLMMSCLLRRHRQLVEEAEVGGKRLWRMSFCQGQDFSTALGLGRIRDREPWRSAGPKLRHRHGSSGSARPGRVDVRPRRHGAAASLVPTEKRGFALSVVVAGLTAATALGGAPIGMVTGVLVTRCARLERRTAQASPVSSPWRPQPAQKPQRREVERRVWQDRAQQS
jgi:hypothetical protein